MARIGTAYVEVSADFDPLFRQIKANMPKIRAELDAIKGPQIEGEVDVDTARATEKIDKLSTESVTVKGNFDLDTSAATAKIELLKREAAGIGGGIGGGAGAVVGGSSGSSGLAKAGFIASNPLITAIAAGLPLLPTVGSSLLQGVLGAGALGAAGAGAGAVGFGSIAATAGPAIAHLKDVTTAEGNLAKAVATYGKNSTEAKAATAELQAAQSKLPKSGQAFASALEDIQNRWAQLSSPAQNTFFHALQDGLSAVNKQLPMFANVAGKSMTAARGAFDDFLTVLDSHDFHDFVHTMTVTFAKSVGPLEQAFQNLARIMMRIAVAAAPSFVRMAKSFREMTRDWLISTDNAHKLRQSVNGLVGQFKDWLRLIGAIGNVLGELFLANTRGAEAGGNAIKKLTHTLNGWADWIAHHHHEVNQFFINVLHTVEILGKALGNLAKSISPISDAFVPISNAILKITTALNNLKVGNVSALTVLLGALTARGIAGKVGLLGAAGSAASGGAGLLARLGLGAASGGTELGGGLMLGGELGGGGGAAALATNPLGLAIAATLGIGIGGSELMGQGTGLANPLDTTSVGDKLGSGLMSSFADSLKKNFDLPRKVMKSMIGEMGQATQGDLSKFSSPITSVISDLKNRYGSLVRAGADMSGHEKDAWIAIAQQARDSGDITSKQLHDLTDAFTRSGQQWQQQMQKAAKATGESTKQIASSVGDASVHVSGAYKGMVKVVGGGLTWLTSNTSRAAQALGINQEIKFHTTPSGNALSDAGGPTSHGAALGGFLPGYSTKDNIPLMARGGEAILRPEDHVPIVSRALRSTYGFGLKELFARTGAKVQRLAKGGFAYPFSKGMPLGRIDEGIDANVPGAPIGAIGNAIVTSMANAFAPSFGSSNQGMVYKLTPPPKGYAPSSPYVYIYEGLDKVGGLGRKLSAGQLLGHIHASYPGIEMGWAAGPSGPALAAGHYSEGQQTAEGQSFMRFIRDLASGKAVSGAAAQQLRRLILHGPDGSWHLRKTGQGALDKVWKAGNAYLAKHQPKGSLGGVGLGSLGKLGHSVRGKVSWFTGGGTAGGYNASTDAGIALNLNPGTDAGWNNPTTQKWMQMARAGHPQVAKVMIAGHSAALPIIDLGPAGFTGRAIDVTAPGVRRLGLSTSSFPTDSVGVAKYAKGGFVPWYGNGADFIANRPQIIGVGDGGPERVRVGPPGGDDVHVHNYFSADMQGLADFIHVESSVEYDERDGLNLQLARMNP